MRPMTNPEDDEEDRDSPKAKTHDGDPIKCRMAFKRVMRKNGCKRYEAQTVERAVASW